MYNRAGNLTAANDISMRMINMKEEWYIESFRGVIWSKYYVLSYGHKRHAAFIMLEIIQWNLLILSTKCIEFLSFLIT